MKVQVVIDLEMCGVQARTKRYPHKQEIIQIGAVMMNENFEITDKFSTYVQPRFGKIDHHILTLTGISDKNVKDAPDIETALKQMMEWIGDNDVVFYAWSVSDYHQIMKEIELKGLSNPQWDVLLDPKNWIDYQEKLGERLQSPKLLRLSEALELTELDIEGRCHDGLDDAYNTARMIAKLERNKDYQTLIEKLRVMEEEQQPLTASFGYFLQGLVLESA